MAKFNTNLPILSNRRLSEEYFVLSLQAGNEVKDIKPGQFVQLRVDASDSTFLRRPISVYDTDTEKNTLDLLIKIAGDGTRTLSLLKKGDSISVLYPLGNSFTIPEPGKKIVLVGGGVGVAPLYLAGKALVANGLKVEFILGYRSSDQLIDLDSFSSLGKVHLSTEDGSAGIKGFVTDHPALKSNDIDAIYCCGPDLMMKAVAKIAATSNTACEVSLENLMACGIGICLCCIEPTVNGNLCACTDGPVFNIKDLKWQI